MDVCEVAAEYSGDVDVFCRTLPYCGDVDVLGAIAASIQDEKSLNGAGLSSAAVCELD